MSSVVTVKAYDLHKALTTLRPLFPKGSQDVPIGIHLERGVMKIVCIQGLVYQACIEVDDKIAINHSTVIYYDISPVLPKTGNIEIEFTETHMIICEDTFEAQFPVAYSVVEEQDFSKLVFSNISNTGFQYGLGNLLNMNLEKLYNQISPISIKESLALQRFQNVWVQVRSNGLPFSSLIDSDHVSLILKFEPTKVCMSVPGVLTFSNDIGYIQLPCKNDNDSGKITDFMSDLSEPVTVDIKHYLDRLRQISKLDTKAQCRISIYKSGIITTLSRSNTKLSVTAGNADELVQVCTLPIQVWLTYLKGLNSETIQILVGGGKLCLRNQTMIIVTRVLS